MIHISAPKPILRSFAKSEVMKKKNRCFEIKVSTAKIAKSITSNLTARDVLRMFENFRTRPLWVNFEFRIILSNKFRI